MPCTMLGACSYVICGCTGNGLFFSRYVLSSHLLLAFFCFSYFGKVEIPSSSMKRFRQVMSLARGHITSENELELESNTPDIKPSNNFTFFELSPTSTSSLYTTFHMLDLSYLFP